MKKGKSGSFTYPLSRDTGDARGGSMIVSHGNCEKDQSVGLRAAREKERRKKKTWVMMVRVCAMIVGATCGEGRYERHAVTLVQA